MAVKKARYYEGRFYANWIDPLLKPIRHALCDLVEPDATAMDIGCGTGALAMQLCKKCKIVVGIDGSEPMIRHARRIQAAQGIDNLSLICTNALSVIDDFKGHRFDYALFSMMLHEVPPQTRLELILGARKIARHILFADYCIPLRFPLSATIFMIERMAGREHFRNFRNFSHAGGLLPLMKAASLRASGEQTRFGGNICILKSNAAELENLTPSR